MKKIYFLIIALVVITACQPKLEIESVDLNEVNKKITGLADNYLKAWNAEDINVLMAVVADDGMFYGSDPSELMDKASLEKMFAQVFADTTADYNYTIDVRKIKLASDAKSAIVVEHITMSDWSPMLKMRQTFQMVKISKDWKIDFISWGFITKNEDVKKLNKALK